MSKLTKTATFILLSTFLIATACTTTSKTVIGHSLKLRDTKMIYWPSSSVSKKESNIIYKILRKKAQSHGVQLEHKQSVIFDLSSEGIPLNMDSSIDDVLYYSDQIKDQLGYKEVLTVAVLNSELIEYKTPIYGNPNCQMDAVEVNSKFRYNIYSLEKATMDIEFIIDYEISSIGFKPSDKTMEESIYKSSRVASGRIF